MENFNFNKFVTWVFQGLVAGGVIFAANNISKTTDSIEKLNQSIATVIERVSWQGKEIERHDSRILNLESSKRGFHNRGE